MSPSTYPSLEDLERGELARVVCGPRGVIFSRLSEGGFVMAIVKLATGSVGGVLKVRPYEVPELEAAFLTAVRRYEEGADQ